MEQLRHLDALLTTVNQQYKGHQRLAFRRMDIISEDVPGQHWHPSLEVKEVGIRSNTTASAEFVFAIRRWDDTS